MEATETTREEPKTILLAGIAAAVFVALFFFATPVTENHQGFDSDGMSYGVMAGSPLFPNWLGHIAPFCYRVLTPYLASRLPWGLLDNFRALALVSNVFSLLLMFLILRRLGFSRVLSALGMIFYGGVFWTVRFSFYSPAYIDYQTQFFLLTLVYLTLRRALFLLPCVFFFAALQKESLALFSLFSVVYLLRHEPRLPGIKRAVYLSLLPGSAFGTLLLLTALVPIYGPHNALHPLKVIAYEIYRLFQPAFWPVLLQAAWSGLGLLPVVFLLRCRPCLDFLRANREWIVYAGIAILLFFGGSDKSRLFLYFLPLAVILAVHSAQDLRQFQPQKRFILWAAGFLALHLFLGGYLTPMPDFSDYLARFAPEHAGTGFWPFFRLDAALCAAAFVLTAPCLIQAGKSARIQKPESKIPGGMV